MNYMDDVFKIKKVDKSKRITKILLIFIILIVIGIIATMICMAIFKEKKFVVTINNEDVSEIKNILDIEEDGTLYIPIRDIAQYLGYESYNGDYINKSESTDKCYIQTDKEAVNFVVKSNRIEKINTDNNEITYFDIDEPIKMKDGKLYTTIDGIKTAFNVNFSYDKEQKQISIYTMQYLVENYKEKMLEMDYSGVSEEFEDEKAVIKGLLIVEDDKGKIGVYNVGTENDILEPKYDSIKYISMSNDFLVESNGKFGIMTSEGKEKIKLQYESIELINQETKLYVVKKDDRYGVINQNEKTIIPIKYNEIGVDAGKYTKNGIGNKYIILDKIIPVMKSDLWGFYNIEGKQVVKCKYQGFGCEAPQTKNSNALLVIPDYNVIIAKKEEGYCMVNIEGEELFGGKTFEEAYLKVELDKASYYIVSNEKKYNAIKQLEKSYGDANSKKNDNKNSEEQKNKENEDSKNEDSNNENDDSKNEKKENN